MECQVCYETFRDPRLLDCGHTFCFYCIRRLVDNTSLSCPICRAQIVYCEEWRPKKNYQLAGLIGELKKIQQETIRISQEPQDSEADSFSSYSFSLSESSTESVILMPLLHPIDSPARVRNTIKSEYLCIIGYFMLMTPFIIAGIHSLTLSDSSCPKLQHWMIAWVTFSILSCLFLIFNIGKNQSNFDRLTKPELIFKILLGISLLSIFILTIIGYFLLWTYNSYYIENPYLWIVSLINCLFITAVLSSLLFISIFKHLHKKKFFKGYEFSFNLSKHSKFIIFHVLFFDIKNFIGLLAIIIGQPCENQYQDWFVVWTVLASVLLVTGFLAFGSNDISAFTSFLWVLLVLNGFFLLIWFVIGFARNLETNSCYKDNFLLWNVNAIICGFWLVVFIVLYFAFNLWLLTSHRRRRF